jgi:hypothetical protein
VHTGTTSRVIAIAVGIAVASLGTAHVRSVAAADYETLRERVEAGEPVAVDELRRAQQADLDRLRAEYRDKAIAQGGQDDALLAEYDAKVKKVQDKYLGIDTRKSRIQESLAGAGAKNTGSDPKDVRADVDTGSPDAAANRKILEDMQARGHEVDTSQPHKIVDKTDDHTHWLAETPEGQRAKAQDTDAYRTTGGREAVGNQGELRDAYGEQLDHRGKFEHGRAAGDLKTQGKTLVKAADSAGTKRLDPKTGKTVKDPGATLEASGLSPEDARRTYDQAKSLQKYGDTVQAGITRLEDSPEVERQKVGEFQERAGKVMDAAEARGVRKSEIRDAVRENFAEAHRDAARTSDAVRTNEDPEFRNRAEGIERERARVAESHEVGEDYVKGEKAKATAEETFTGGWRDPDAGSAARAADAHHSARVDANEPRPRTAAAAGAAAEAGAAHRPAGRKGLGDQLADGVDLAGQIADVGTHQAGKAIDENRDLGAQDAVDAAAELSGAPALYDAGKRAAEGELAKVHRGEQGRTEAFGRALAGTAKGVVVDPITETVERNIREEEERAARAGEEPSYLRSSGGAAAEIAGNLTGVKGVADAHAEASTWKERADWAAQKAALGQKVDDELRWREKRIHTLQSELEQLAQTSDPDDRTARERIDGKLAELRGEHDRLRRTGEMAERTLAEADPERIAKARTIAAAVPRYDDVADWIEQLRSERRRTPPAAPPDEPGGEAVGEAESEAAIDDELQALLGDAERENDDALADDEARSADRRERDRQRIASVGARVEEAASDWRAQVAPEAGVDVYQDAVARARIARGASPAGIDPDPYGAGGLAEATVTASSAAGSAGADFATCKRLCMQHVDSYGGQLAADQLPTLENHCDFQCRTATSGQPIDYYQHCIESIRRLNPAALAGAEARARVEATCRRSVAAAR